MSLPGEHIIAPKWAVIFAPHPHSPDLPLPKTPTEGIKRH